MQAAEITLNYYIHSGILSQTMIYHISNNKPVVHVSKLWIHECNCCEITYYVYRYDYKLHTYARKLTCEWNTKNQRSKLKEEKRPV